MKKVFAVFELEEIEVLTDVGFSEECGYHSYGYDRFLSKVLEQNDDKRIEIQTKTYFITKNELWRYFTSKELAETYILDKYEFNDDTTYKIEELYITDWKYSKLEKEERLD